MIELGAVILAVNPTLPETGSNKLDITTLIVASLGLVGAWVTVALEARTTRSESSKTREQEGAILLVPACQDLKLHLTRLSVNAEHKDMDLKTFLCFYCSPKRREAFFGKTASDDIFERTSEILNSLELAINKLGTWGWDAQSEKVLEQCLRFVVRVKEIALSGQENMTTCHLDKLGADALTTQLSQALESGALTPKLVHGTAKSKK